MAATTKVEIVDDPRSGAGYIKKVCKLQRWRLAGRERYEKLLFVSFCNVTTPCFILEKPISMVVLLVQK